MGRLFYLVAALLRCVSAVYCFYAMFTAEPQRTQSVRREKSFRLGPHRNERLNPDVSPPDTFR